MNSEIINVGTELLTGDTLNTNVQFLSQELSQKGFSVHYHTVIGDNYQRLQGVLEQAVQRSQIIIITGGLGPTQDDMTKQTVAAFFDLPLIEDPAETEKIKKYFNDRHLVFTDNNMQQAFIPEGAKKLENLVGTAPGVMIEKNGIYVFLLPGPPYEMKKMFTHAVLPILTDLAETKVLSHYYNLAGIGESMVEDMLMDIIDGQTNPTIATYAKTGEVLVRLTMSGNDEDRIRQGMAPYEDIIRERLQKYIFTESRQTLPEFIGKQLIAKGLTIACAESCTGGQLSGELAKIPGISAALKMGLVTYSNEAKVSLLNVSEGTLEQYGAVSPETCLEMCTHLSVLSGCDIALSVTGIAGPGGGTESKPVGLVYIGCHYQGETTVKECHFTGSREIIQKRVINAALNLIRLKVLNR